MKKEGLFFILVFGILLVLLSAVVSAELNLKVTGTINDYGSDLWIKTNPSAGTGLDAYDMKVPSSPSNYSQFYSTVTGNSLSIDSWQWENAKRELSLVYSIPESQTGSLTLTWDKNSIGGEYVVTLQDYGTDNSYGSLLGETDMKVASNFTKTAEGISSLYFKIVVSPETAAEQTPTGGGGSGGGGGRELPSAPEEKVHIENKEMDIYMTLGEVLTRKISLHNKRDKITKVELDVKELKDILSIKERAFDMAPNEKKEVDVRVISPDKPGIYTGKIIVREKTTQEILVAVHISTKELLFDVVVSVLDDYKLLNVGNKLKSQIILTPMGERERLDVSLNYMIKDFDGRIFLKESETLLVEGEKKISREFATENIPPGSYILGLELIYPNGVAVSSSHFEVKGKEVAKAVSYNLVFIVLGIGIFVLLVLIIFLIIKYKNIRKHRKIRR